MAAKSPYLAVAKLLLMQILIVALVPSGFFFVGGWENARSAFLGGIAALLPNIYFTLRIVRKRDADAQTVVRAFYAGEAGKLALTVLLFYLIFQLPSIKIAPLLLTYAAVLSTFWIVLVLHND